MSIPKPCVAGLHLVAADEVPDLEGDGRVDLCAALLSYCILVPGSPGGRLVAEADLVKAVAHIRHSRGYRVLVWAFRCLPIGLVFGAVTVASVLVRIRLVTVTLFAVAFVAIGVGMVLGWTGMLMLHADGVMPRGGTNRHRAMMRSFWRDVAGPIRADR